MWKSPNCSITPPKRPKQRSTPKGSDIKKYLIALLLPLTAAISLSLPASAFADVNNFTVTDFSADYYLTNADRQGQMRVVEKISVDFTDNNHGILRALPESYKGRPLRLRINHVSSTSGAPAQFTKYTSNGNEVLKIGDPNRTVTGEQEYTIDYTEQNVIGFYQNHDELYWDINGDQWDQPFTAVHASVHLPQGLKLWSQAPQCYTGTYGSTAHDCSISVAGNVIEASASDLGTQTTLTVVAGFQKGYFHPMTWGDFLRDYGIQIAEFVLPILLLGGAGFVWWLKRGRDAKGRGTIIPEYDAPDNMTPLEVGTIIDFVTDNRDITATIIDLAIRGYIRIVETDGTQLKVIKKKSYELQVRNQDWSGLNDWEHLLMENLFGAPGTQDAITLSAMANKFYSVAMNIKRAVADSLTARGYFVSNPSRYITVSISAVVVFVWVAIFFAGNILPGWLIGGLIIGVILFAIFYHAMPARTAKGVAAKEHILGLKMYLEVAEKDRIAMLQSPDAPYAENSGEPAHTVELFEKLLPYAIVLKVEDKWADKFKNIYNASPDWYSGNYAAFSTGYLIGSLNSGFTSAMNSSFSSPRSSGGSGFGGGFAGGGGGGGGGGGW
jgi:uncharacterized membrane protein YgcG